MNIADRGRMIGEEREENVVRASRHEVGESTHLKGGEIIRDINGKDRMEDPAECGIGEGKPGQGRRADSDNDLSRINTETW